jgi:uncharacterized protein (TIGR00730 family)
MSKLPDQHPIAAIATAPGRGGIGISPQALTDAMAQTGLSELRVVGTMQERKALMASMADGFVALPGGLGTLEELFEVWTAAQLNFHAKPCAVYNACGFYDGLTQWLDRVVQEQFIKPQHRNMLIVESQPHTLLEALSAYQAPVGVNKWVERESR